MLNLSMIIIFFITYFCISVFANWHVLNLMCINKIKNKYIVYAAIIINLLLNLYIFGIFKYKKMKIKTSNVFKWNNLRNRAIFMQKSYFNLFSYQHTKISKEYFYLFYHVYFIKFYFSYYLFSRDTLLRL